MTEHAVQVPVTEAQKNRVRGLLEAIDLSPSPWHAVAHMQGVLLGNGYRELAEEQPWDLQADGRYYVIRGGSSLVAFVMGSQTPASAGYRILGAHTDSPGLRVKPNGAHASGGMTRLGVEVYGGPILATFTDRDLSLAGRVSINTGKGSALETRLLHVKQPLVRIPNLAIHMNRRVNDDGLKLDMQKELPMMLATVQKELPAQKQFAGFLGEQLGLDKEQILAWDLNVYDTQPGALYGVDEEFYANSQIDNLASCHAALAALTETQEESLAQTRVIAFFDHEEVGSMSFKGADGSFLPDVLERIGLVTGVSEEGRRQANAQSFLVSADMAHAYHPNFSEYHDPQHQVRLNGGPVIKINASQRYTTDGLSEACFQSLCDSVDVPWQKYVHRTNLPCGSTIGPMVSARMGIRSVDVGCPMWSMHSVRECAGVVDQELMIRVIGAFFSRQTLP